MSSSTISIKGNPLLFGIVTGAFLSTIITVTVLIWEWLENPGGIYRNATGTNFGIVFETAISWIVPVFLSTFAIATIVHLLWSGIRRRRSQG